MGILLGQNLSRLLYLLGPVVAEPNNKPVSSDHPAKYESLAHGIFFNMRSEFFSLSLYSLLGSL